jgi:hypothetical protein
MFSSPTVLYPFTLPGLLHYIVTTQAPSTTLIICSSRESFLQDLVYSLEQDLSQEHNRNSNLQDLVTPSLHNLFTTRHVKLAFCASVQALLAYLTAYGRNETSSTHPKDSQHKPRLVLVNPLALHAPTPSFSAQGLSRAFAAATETALRSNAVLQVIECQVKRPRIENSDGEDVDMTEGEESHAKEEVEEKDPWDQEVSILNVSARRFGSNSGERAWAGRTLKAKSIAARWFRFKKLDDGEVREDPG